MSTEDRETAQRLTDEWYDAALEYIAEAERDRLVACIAAALAAARREGIESAAAEVWAAESGEGDAWERLDGLTERVRALT
jgi:hypothetical protein